ncbi:MAG: hypothetical protein ABI468_02090 [Candidatus Nanopelagicales bacterium]
MRIVAGGEREALRWACRDVLKVGEEHLPSIKHSAVIGLVGPKVLMARSQLERRQACVTRAGLPRNEHDDLAEAVAWSLGRGVVSDESALDLHGLSE